MYNYYSSNFLYVSRFEVFIYIITYLSFKIVDYLYVFGKKKKKKSLHRHW